MAAPSTPPTTEMAALGVWEAEAPLVLAVWLAEEARDEEPDGEVGVAEEAREDPEEEGVPEAADDPPWVVAEPVIELSEDGTALGARLEIDKLATGLPAAWQACW